MFQDVTQNLMSLSTWYMLAIVPAVTTTTITIIFITANISGDQRTLAQSVEIRIHSTHLINCTIKKTI